MGGRAGGGAGKGMGARGEIGGNVRLTQGRGGGGNTMATYKSGFGSGRTYGLNEAQRFVFEAIKSDAVNFGNAWHSKGGIVYDVNGKSYSETGLASAIKKGWSSAKTQHGATSDKDLARKLTSGMVNVHTVKFFDIKN